ncbi:MAG: Rieske 2Fe-2S domain-containing protein [Hyphomicrobiaceae bacterium]
MTGDCGWVRVAEVGDLSDGTGYESDVEIEGETVGLFELDGSYFALGNCTHEQGPLSQGVVENGSVVCPWHHAVFDIRTGRCIAAPSACRVDGSVLGREAEVEEDVIPSCRTFETKVVDGVIFARPRRTP